MYVSYYISHILSLCRGQTASVELADILRSLKLNYDITLPYSILDYTGQYR